MEQQGRIVSRDEFEGRSKIVDERFARDKERLDEYQKAIADMTRISSQLSQIVERHDKDLAKHEERLDELDRKPGKRWDALTGALLGAAAAALVTYLASRAGLK